MLLVGCFVTWSLNVRASSCFLRLTSRRMAQHNTDQNRILYEYNKPYYRQSYRKICMHIIIVNAILSFILVYVLHVDMIHIQVGIISIGLCFTQSTSYRWLIYMLTVVLDGWPFVTIVFFIKPAKHQPWICHRAHINLYTTNWIEIELGIGLGFRCRHNDRPNIYFPGENPLMTYTELKKERVKK